MTGWTIAALPLWSATIVVLLVICRLVTSRFSPAPLAATVCQVFLVSSATIVLCGYVASAFHRLTDPVPWLMSEIVVMAVAALTMRRWPPGALTVRAPPPTRVPLARWERAVLWPMIAAIGLTGLLNAVVLFSTAPRALDGLTYHLARVAYYLQHDSLDFYDANFWAQVVHPRNSAVLSVYAYLVAGGSERAASIWQYVSYWTAVVAVFGITTETGGSRRQALFAALVFGLTTQSLMQASTAGNDMILAAFGAVAVYGLLAYRRDPRLHHLATAAVALGLGIGTKWTFVLTALPVGVVALFVIRGSRQPRATAARFGTCCAIAALLFVLPSGYVTTLQRFAHPLGPPSVRQQHTFEGRDPGLAAKEGAKNILRFGLDFVSLDGLPRLTAVNQLQVALRQVPVAAIQRLGIDLESPRDARAPFRYERIASAHEVHAHWGVLGFALVWASVFAALAQPDSGGRRLLAWLALLYVVLQAFAGPYDPWRGRYFITAAIFAAPVAASWMAGRRRVGRAYLIAAVWIGCGSAVSAVVLRSNGMLVTAHHDGHVRPSLFGLDRLGQMTLNIAKYEAPLRRYESMVPADAIVAVALRPESFEYPLFGERLTRTLVPINSFGLGIQSIPAMCQFLLYSPDVEAARPGDIWLGEDWYLRVLEVH